MSGRSGSVDGWVGVGWGMGGGGVPLLFEARCQCGMPKIAGADNSQTWRAITQMLGCNITAVDERRQGTSQMDPGPELIALVPVLSHHMEAIARLLLGPGIDSPFGATYS